MRTDSPPVPETEDVPETDDTFLPEPSSPLPGGTVSAVIVSFSDPAATRRAVDSLLSQSSPPIEVLVLDNHPQRLTATAIAGWTQDARVRLIHSGHNLGYTVACNRAAATAAGDWLFFLNPDAHAHVDCLARLLRSADARAGVLGAQVLLPDGQTNAGDNPVHINGIAWAGRFGEPRETGAARRVAAVSGAALLARTRAYRALGGVCESFFMYYEDIDLCWRMRLAGWDVVFCPEALAWHEYSFDKGVAKWYWLERNRLWSVVSNYSFPTLLLLSPLLAGSEAVVAVFALRQGWLKRLVRAWGSISRQAREVVLWRRAVQATRRVSDAQLIELMTGSFETGLVGGGVLRRLNAPVRLYRRIALAILRTVGR